MKKIILLIVFTFTTLALFAQCSDLFISEYVEGYGNNRALELYNPTNADIDMSEYSVGRFSNGGTSYEGIVLPNDMLAPFETYVVVLEKLDSLGSGFETPIWNGYQLYDYCLDVLTGDTIVTMDGDTISCVQYNADGLHLYGTEYRDFLDLKGKADAFVCPVYAVNNAMYFNGNDAVALVKGATINGDGSNILDVIGVIGDPAMANNDSWVDASGGWLTRDKTLARNPDVLSGTGPIAHALQDTFAYAEYTVWWKNYFDGIGSHECACELSATNELTNESFTLYPNPVSNEMVVKAQSDIERVEIYNMLGERVLSLNCGVHVSSQVDLSVGKLETGVYVISLFFENDRQAVQKFVKE